MIPFGNYVDCIYHYELKIKDATDTARLASYPDIYI